MQREALRLRPRRFKILTKTVLKYLEGLKKSPLSQLAFDGRTMKKKVKEQILNFEYCELSDTTVLQNLDLLLEIP